MTELESQIVLKAFIGRSFLDSDKAVWLEIREMLEMFRPLGFVFEDAKQAQPMPVSQKVREGIERNDIYIAVLTRRAALCDSPTGFFAEFKKLFKRLKHPMKWSTSDWVIQESGYALGRNRHVLMLIERGVSFPESDLDGDMEWISFDRNDIRACQISLTEMINRLIAKRASISSKPLLASQGPPPEPVSTETEETKKEPQFQQWSTLLEQEQFAEAQALEGALVESFHDLVGDKKFLRFYLTGERARYGDASALMDLKTAFKAAPADSVAAVILANCLSTLGSKDEAEQVLQKSFAVAVNGGKNEIGLKLFNILLEGKDFQGAYDILVSLFQHAKSDEERVIVLSRMAMFAREVHENDTQAAAFEQALILQPTDHAVRFNLAYLYDQMDRPAIAAFHYGVYLINKEDPLVQNNLGVVYSQLGIKSKEIKLFLAASAKLPLAQANLSQAYVDRGFIEEARDHARNAIKNADDEIARARANDALDRVNKLSQEDESAVNAIAQDTKEERNFRARYALALLTPFSSEIEGAYVTKRHGEILLNITISTMFGHGRREVPESNALAVAFIKGAGIDKDRKKIELIEVHGTLTGCAGTAEITVASRYSDESEHMSKTITHKCLFYIDNDKRLEFFEPANDTRNTWGAATLKQ